MGEYQQIVSKLGENTKRVVEQVAARMISGELEAEAFYELAANLIAQSNARGYALGETRLAALLSAQTGLPPGAVIAGVEVEPAAIDVERLSDALRVANADPETAAMRIGRVARSEPVQSARAALGKAMSKRPEVIGYRREIEGDACELCEWLERDGFVWHPDKPMHAHIGCECQAIPVTEHDR